MTRFAEIALLLILARGAAQLGLEWMNRRHVQAHAGAVPDAFRDFIPPDTYFKSVQYTLAQGDFGKLQHGFDTTVLIVFLFSGVLPWAYQVFVRDFGTSAWAMAAYLFVVGLALSLPGMPLDWYAQFRLEARFGFNTTTPRTWWLDRLKGLLVSLVLLYPLLALVLTPWRLVSRSYLSLLWGCPGF